MCGDCIEEEREVAVGKANVTEGKPGERGVLEVKGRKWFKREEGSTGSILTVGPARWSQNGPLGFPRQKSS